MAETNIMDSLRVIRGALMAASSAASIAISTDVLVLHADKKRQMRAKP
jgi:hypothetical protein